MDEFNSDDHYIYYCGQESLRRNGVAIIVNKSPKFCTWMQSQKRQNDLICFQGKPFSITVIQVCAPTSNTEEAEGEQFYSSVGKESTCSAGDPSLGPGWGRSTGEGKGSPTPVFLGFPCGSAGKESACNAGDLGSIAGLGRFPGEGKGCPLQYSGLENSMDSPWCRRVRHD